MGIKVTSEICNAVRTKMVESHNLPGRPIRVIEVAQAFAKIAKCKHCKHCEEHEIKRYGFFGTCMHDDFTVKFAVKPKQLCERFSIKPETEKARRK